MTFEYITSYKIEVTPPKSDAFHTRDDHQMARIVYDIVQAALATYCPNAIVAFSYLSQMECSHCGCSMETALANGADAERLGVKPGTPLCCDRARDEEEQS